MFSNLKQIGGGHRKNVQIFVDLVWNNRQHMNVVYLCLAVNEWMSAKHLKTLGIPVHIGFGCFEKNNKRYRFMVMKRFGADLQKVFETNGHRFSPKTAFALALKLVGRHDY